MHPPFFKGYLFGSQKMIRQAAPMKTEFVMITRAKKASNCQASTFLEAILLGTWDLNCFLDKSEFPRNKKGKTLERSQLSACPIF
jgi:hypothetical protein